MVTSDTTTAMTTTPGASKALCGHDERGREVALRCAERHLVAQVLTEHAAEHPSDAERASDEQ